MKRAQGKVTTKLTYMFETITTWIESHRDIAILVIPFFAFAEACVGIGLFISGAILLALSTYLYKQGFAPVTHIVPLAFLGALAGDQFGYYVGRYLGPRFHESKFAQKYVNKIHKTEKLIREKGVYAIFVGRLIPAVRSLVPLMTGISGFERKRYAIYDGLACMLWASLLGILVVGIDQLI